ncbi:M20 family metallopeptidase [Microbacterium sp. CFBP9034]|uniref:M20 family metallopeptidase n=1 Tax=Microbacterium sp. CFBP9034 TaxID=3096540 RepID=UPI002A69ABC2|nr:M20 family metallopeptidase [Microbacterium sp. CFBP9034]MDY0909701.1 M20 family metallopeptidase [Microbacterium sp. CFBP9034]
MITVPAEVTADTLVGTVRRLVECESPSADRAAVARSAAAVAAIGGEILDRDPEWIVVDGVTHLRWRFGAETRVVVLAHHDTVWPLGTLGRIPFAVHDGILSGPGCFDMKAGLAMAFHAVAGLADRDGVTILVTGDEEIGSPRSRELIEDTARGARAVLVLEASADGGCLKLERKGVSLYELVVDGLAAHAGLEPERGVNATVELAHKVLAVASLADPAIGTSVTPTVAGSGSTTNTVPARASLWVDVRARTAGEQERVDAALRALEPVTPGAVLEVRGGINRPPLEATASASLFLRAQANAARLGQAPLDGVAVGGASDGNFTAGIGVPTLDGLGAVGGGAHAEHEHVVVAELAPRTRLLTALIHELAADEQGDS